MSKVSEKGGAKIDAASFQNPVSHDYEAFKALIEAYKLQNTKKYEAKKEQLEKKLAALKN